MTSFGKMLHERCFMNSKDRETDRQTETKTEAVTETETDRQTKIQRLNEREREMERLNFNLRVRFWLSFRTSHVTCDRQKTMTSFGKMLHEFQRRGSVQRMYAVLQINRISVNYNAPWMVSYNGFR